MKEKSPLHKSVLELQGAPVFDKMSLKCELSYNKFTDHVTGYKDKGQLATHAGLHMK